MALESTPLLKEHIIKMPDDLDDIDSYEGLKSLSYEELSPYLNDPWWKNLRTTFFLSFWCTLLFIFLLACILSILENSCPANSNSTEYITIPISYGASVTTKIV